MNNNVTFQVTYFYKATKELSEYGNTKYLSEFRQLFWGAKGLLNRTPSVAFDCLEGTLASRSRRMLHEYRYKYLIQYISDTRIHTFSTEIPLKWCI